MLATLLGIASFLVTGPIAAAQLRLLPVPRLNLKTYAALYYAITGPTLTFQAVALSSSVLVGFVPGGELTANTARTVILTGLLGAGLYALVAILMNLVIHEIGKGAGA